MYDYFELTEEEIQIVEKTMRPMDANEAVEPAIS